MGFLRAILAVVTGVLGLILAMPLFLFVLPFWLVSFFTRGIARIIEPRFLTRDQLIQFDPVFGWKPRPNLNTYHLMVDLFHLTTDADGWRGNVTLGESDIVVFGDSFAAGYGVGERHFFANLAAQPRIKSIGTGGYSMVQELLWMKKLAPGLEGKLIVWFIYHGNDLYDNLVPDLRGYRKPFLRKSEANGAWEIVSSHVKPEKWPIITQGRMQGENHLPKLAELCSDTFLAKRAYNACEYLIASGNQICSDTSASLVIMSVPDACQLTNKGHQSLKARGGNVQSFDPSLPDKQIQKMCLGLGLTFIAARNFLDTSCYKSNDCHWNERGHRRVSDELVRIYTEHESQTRELFVPANA